VSSIGGTWPTAVDHPFQSGENHESQLALHARKRLVSGCCSNRGAAAPTFGGPVSGLWAHPGDGGRGFNIDLQGSTMIVTTFVYTETGSPIWYLSSGPFDHKTGMFKSGYDSYSNGQCFGCAPNQPVVHNEAAGKMTISFHDNQHATLTTPSGPLEIQKLNYGFADANDVLYGEWAFSLNVSGLYSGDWVIFNQAYTAADGTKYVAGFTDDFFKFAGLGRWVSSDVGYLVLIKENNYYDAYRFFSDDHRGMGLAGSIRRQGAQADRVLRCGLRAFSTEANYRARSPIPRQRTLMLVHAIFKSSNLS
jgi:hypothetical protein